MALKVSIIIASYKNGDNLRRCLEACMKLESESFEVIVAGPIKPVLLDYRIKWLRVNGESQGAKRNAALHIAQGEVCAFIDDDATPRSDWLRNAMGYFQDESIGAVCGPGVAPLEETLMERGTSAVLASPLATGPARCRYKACSRRFVDDIGSACNLFVRHHLLWKIEGFPVGIRAAEEAFLSKRIRGEGKRILYAPDVIVFHKRRALFAQLATQIGTYALHRGFLLKEHKELRTRFTLLPFLLVAVFVGACFVPLVLFGLVLSYLFLSFESGLVESGSFQIACLVMLGIPLVHFVYTAEFFRGLLSKELRESPSY